MKLFNPFQYHKTITLLSGVFGAVFNEITLERDDGTKILVPIAYATKQKYDVRNEQNPEPNKLKYKTQLPRMSFKLNSWRRDTERSLSRFQMLVEQGVDRTQVQGLSSQRNRVPFIFGYELNVKAKNIQDMLQIVEQVLVMFNPSLNVKVKDNPDLNEESAINIKLLDSQMQDIFEGSFEDEQVLETTFNFELEGWLYMPTADSKIITKVIVNVFDLSTNQLLETYVEVP